MVGQKVCVILTTCIFLKKNKNYLFENEAGIVEFPKKWQKTCYGEYITHNWIKFYYKKSHTDFCQLSIIIIGYA